MCTGCHPANGGSGPGHTGPALGGLSAIYLKRQLHAFKDHHRQNEVGGMMGSMMQSLNDEQIDELATYYSAP
jgi:cytochrome c553